MTEPISKTNAKAANAPQLRPLVVCATLLLTASLAFGQAAPHKHKPHKAKPSPMGAVQPAPVPQPPPEPEQPKWPANEAPTQPAVTWDAQGLRIQAANSSLSKILSDVSTQTGAKIEGLSGDERVFGEYGPGQARDVLSQLLHGSGYNFLLLGDQGQGTPREVILTRKHSGSVPNNMNQGGVRNNPEPQPDEEVEQPEQEQPEPPQVIQPPVQPMPPNQDNGPMTPQQRMQLMQQQRMQQLQQMQQQQQQQQQQPQ